MSEEGNIVYSCPEHGLEVYRKLKNNPSVPKDYVYSYFPPVALEDGRQLIEKMWIKITKGNRMGGEGILDNEPQHNPNFKLHDVVRFKTDENDITRAFQKITNQKVTMTWKCTECEHEYSACLGDDEVPSICECGGKINHQELES